MGNVERIWDQLIDMSKRFESYLSDEADLDEKLEAYERFLEDREPLIDQLATLSARPDQSRIDCLYQLDQRIQSSLESWMKGTQKSISELKAQREAMLKVKRSQGGYAKQTASREGYFFDKKK